VKKNSNLKHINQFSEKPWLIHRFKENEIKKPLSLNNYLNQELVLKDYQKEGIKWLLEEDGRIMADDMGLGKTLQAIAASAELIVNKEIRNVLIVCPSSLVRNWCDELIKWAPDFVTFSITNTGNRKDEIWSKLFGYSHYVVTNYEQIRDIPNALLETEIDLIIADEAHKLRKKTSKIFKSIQKLKYRKFWALTGTPIEKNTNDVFNLLKIINPNKNIGTIKDHSNISLRAFLRNHILRRLKSNVLNELKDFSELKHFVPLNDNQKENYDKLCKELYLAEDENKLAIYGKLKSICDYDDLSQESSKLDFIEDLLDKINQRNEKSIVFSFSLEPLKVLKERLNRIYSESYSILFTGALDREARNKAIDSFKNDNSCKVFLCSGKIGGEGLNLTEANHAIFLNEWWNPSNNTQARDRIIRIGQNKEAFIHHVYTSDTIESRVIKILKSKKEITLDVIGKLAID
jgi:SNF2 family DNA or RNA helicase